MINPFEQNISIVDCGDFPISPFDNALAFAQMEEWYSRLLSREVKTPEKGFVSKKVCSYAELLHGTTDQCSSRAAENILKLSPWEGTTVSRSLYFDPCIKSMDRCP